MGPRTKAVSPRGSRYAAWVVVSMIAMLVVPATLTLLQVERSRPGVDPSTNPTPLGYTWSLLLYVVPLLVLAFWFLRHPQHSFQKTAFGTTIAILVPLGFVLDLVFGTRFFTFSNRGATLGIDVPAVGGAIPVEEFVFYTAGFVFVLLLYVWSDEYWVAAYNVPDYSAESAKVGRLLRLPFEAVFVWLAVTYTSVIVYEAVKVWRASGKPLPEGAPSASGDRFGWSGSFGFWLRPPIRLRGETLARHVGRNPVWYISCCPAGRGDG